MNLPVISIEARSRDGIVSAETLTAETKGDRLVWQGLSREQQGDVELKRQVCPLWVPSHTDDVATPVGI